MATMGMPWIRLDTGVGEHPKTQDLCDELNEPLADAYLTRLWCWVGKYYPTGEIAASARRIEQAVRWAGAPGALVDAMARLHIIDSIEGGFTCHGWAEHNGAAFAKMEADRERLRQKRAIKSAPAPTKDGPATATSESPATVARQSFDNPATVERASHVTGRDVTGRDEEREELSSGKPDPMPLQSTSEQGPEPVQPSLVLVDEDPNRKRLAQEAKAAEDRRITEVLAHWREKAGMPGAAIEGKQADERRRRIGKWLARSWSVDRLKLVADGLTRDDFLMGRDPKSKRGGYRDVATVYRDQEQLERLERLALGTQPRACAPIAARREQPSVLAPKADADTVRATLATAPLPSFLASPRKESA